MLGCEARRDHIGPRLLKAGRGRERTGSDQLLAAGIDRQVESFEGSRSQESLLAGFAEDDLVDRLE